MKSQNINDINMFLTNELSDSIMHHFFVMPVPVNHQYYKVLLQYDTSYKESQMCFLSVVCVCNFFIVSYEGCKTSVTQKGIGL